LIWEPPLLEFWLQNKIPHSLDQGWSVWQELTASDFWLEIPLSVQLATRTRYFEKLLAEGGREREIVRTEKGLSAGYLRLLAGKPGTALKLLEREAAEFMEDPAPLLHLGNAHLLLGDGYAARMKYRDALLTDLPESSYEDILDHEVRGFLKRADYPDWAVIEGCITGVFPVTRLRSRESMESLASMQSWFGAAADTESAPSALQQFYACLVISENRKVAGEEILMKARLHMKFLHSKLHRLHMETLG
jgi:hypothetical protein